MMSDLPESVKNNPRKLAELAIIENMGDEAACKKILEDAFLKKLFTEDEINVIVAEIRAMNAKKSQVKKENPEHTRITRAMFAALGPTVSMVLSKLIRQMPYRLIEEGWMVPDVKDIMESVRISEASVYEVFNRLSFMEIIKKRVNKKLKKLEVFIDFRKVDAIYNTPASSN